MGADRNEITKLFETVSLGAPQNAVGFVLWRVMHRYQREIDRALRPLGLTHLQFTVLALAAWSQRSGETSTQSKLAAKGDIHPMQVSNIVKALDAKGLVMRTPAPGNALAKQVAITEAGLDALREALPLGIAIQARLFGAEGLPGGSLLAMLGAIDRYGGIDADRPA
jgi:DNA-binding MarR family transcriptional regulator